MLTASGPPTAVTVHGLSPPRGWPQLSAGVDSSVFGAGSPTRRRSYPASHSCLHAFDFQGDEIWPTETCTVPHDGGWANRVEGNSRVSNTGTTKAEVQAEGRRMAIDRGVEHFIHNRDGVIIERNTYPRSRDPRSSRG